jgi:general L-amino acid transport system substrate-binding protein
MKKWYVLLPAALALVLALWACGKAEPTKEEPETVSRLQLIKDRGRVIVGCNAELPGFGYTNPSGEFEGFDVDFGRALAAAIFGDATKVEFRPLTAAARLPALQTGEIDVLIRNTTWTLTRDTVNELDWAAVTFFDGQGMMVRRNSGWKTLKDMEGATVATTTGTTTEMNLADSFRSRGIDYTPLLFESTQDTNNAYEQGRADAETSDKSQLAALRSAMADPQEHVILDLTMSKEPLGPVTAHGDNQWNDVVRWVCWGMMQAEESGVNSQNLDQMLSSTDPTVRRLLGVEGEAGKDLGLPADFMVKVIRQVGNYAEVYDRYLGPQGIDIPRGPNRLWKDGGLLYPMAWR